MKERQKKRGPVLLGGMFLLALLTACGLIGAGKRTVSQAGVPVYFETIGAQQASVSSLAEIDAALAADREKAIEMLGGVIDHADTDKETRSGALKRKMEIASRMETEGTVRAVLLHMGYDRLGVVCGEEILTLIAPLDTMQNETERIRILDAASQQSGMPVEQIKIILAKNE